MMKYPNTAVCLTVCLFRHLMFSLKCVIGPGTSTSRLLSQKRTKSGISALSAFKIYSIRRRIAEKLSNKFDESRVTSIGPDLACLEWIMNCGATQVLMSDGSEIRSQRQMKTYIQDVFERKSNVKSRSVDFAYEKKWAHIPNVHIVNVDASDSAIANEGFKYFSQLRKVDSIKLNFCDYFGDEALRELALGRPATTLRDLALRRAHFYFLPYVANRQAFVRQLKMALPRCDIRFPEAEHVGYGYEEKQK